MAIIVRASVNRALARASEWARRGEVPNPAQENSYLAKQVESMTLMVNFQASPTATSQAVANTKLPMFWQQHGDSWYSNEPEHAKAQVRLEATATGSCARLSCTPGKRLIEAATAAGIPAQEVPGPELIFYPEGQNGVFRSSQP
ncbi:MAG: hypothetical protein ACK5H2_12565 [Beutenbergiaceae bacterium]